MLRGVYGEGMHTILLVEDDPQVAGSLVQALLEEGYAPVRASTGAEARAAITAERPSLVLLDLGLPDVDGMTLLSEFRERDPELPLLILSARDGVEDRVTGLDRGAVDYILKPFALPEVLARIRLHLRRSGSVDAAVLRAGNLRLDLLGRRAGIGEDTLELPPREFDLLATLARSVGKAVSREQIARDVWNSPRRMSSLDNLIDVHISRLRERLKDGNAAARLRTIRGVGYVLEVEA